jgi:hypothetical protein
MNVYFKRFVEFEHSVENLLFYLDVEKYRKKEKSELKAAAEKIVLKYLKDDSPDPGIHATPRQQQRWR